MMNNNKNNIILTEYNQTWIFYYHMAHIILIDQLYINKILYN